MVDCIVRAIDGTYIDLSRVVAITPSRQLPNDYGRLYGYDVYFVPEGIPFKQDSCFSVTIQKEFNRPLEVHKEYTTFGGITDKGRKMLDEHWGKCIGEMEQSREALANQWREYKKQI
jgi:hypothetical protein